MCICTGMHCECVQVSKYNVYLHCVQVPVGTYTMDVHTGAHINEYGNAL